MREARPDHRVEDDLGPIIRHEHAVLDDIADRNLHPAVVDHDPERRQRGAEGDHRGRKQIEPGGDPLTAEQKHAEESRL